MPIHVLVFKNFSVSEIVPDFEILDKMPDVISDGKVITLEPGEYSDFGRVTVSQDERDVIFKVYRVYNEDDVAREEFLEEFVLRKYK